jgi:glycosyltransferase involved in cell wall biosynthesis
MIDILLTTYNGEKYLNEQFDSLLNQTVQNFKIIIRDDGCTDRTIDIIKEYKIKYPKQIELIEDNLGNLRSSKSFMKLLEYSTAEYIMFCDQDDIWLPNKIEVSFNKILELERNDGKDISLLVFTDLTVVDEKLSIAQESFWKYQKLNPKISKNWKKLLAQNVITGCTIIMNKRAKEVSLPFKLEIMIHDQWIGVNVAKYGKINYLEEQTILYRQHGSNVAGAHSYGYKYIAYKILKIKKLFRYFNQASKYFNEISFLELLFYKINLNISRIIRK